MEEISNIEEKPTATLKYRGETVEIFYDDYGQQYWCKFNGQEIGFGAFNSSWQDDLKYLIDKKLDLISEFENYPGAYVEFFENGGYRDIRLVYRMRTLKIYPIKENISKGTLDSAISWIKEDAEDQLKTYKESLFPKNDIIENL